MGLQHFSIGTGASTCSIGRHGVCPGACLVSTKAYLSSCRLEQVCIYYTHVHLYGLAPERSAGSFVCSSDALESCRVPYLTRSMVSLLCECFLAFLCSPSCMGILLFWSVRGWLPLLVLSNCFSTAAVPRRCFDIYSGIVATDAA